MGGAITKQSGAASPLPALWRRWTRVVAYFIRHKRGRPLGDDQYRQLHAQILAACEERQKDADLATRELLQRLRELVGPWVTLESLTYANKPILVDLWRRCHEIDQQLHGRRPWARTTVFVSAFVAGVAIVVLLAQAALVWVGDFTVSSLLVEGRSLGYRLWFAVQRAGALEKFAVVSVILVLLGIGMMRTMRTY